MALAYSGKNSMRFCLSSCWLQESTSRRASIAWAKVVSQGGVHIGQRDDARVSFSDVFCRHSLMGGKTMTVPMWHEQPGAAGKPLPVAFPEKKIPISTRIPPVNALSCWMEIVALNRVASKISP
jgi:hypothetical protein